MTKHLRPSEFHILSTTFWFYSSKKRARERENALFPSLELFHTCWRKAKVSFSKAYLKADHVHQTKPIHCQKLLNCKLVIQFPGSWSRKLRFLAGGNIALNYHMLTKKTKNKPSCVIARGLCLDSSIHQEPLILISSRINICNAKNFCLEAHVIFGCGVLYCRVPSVTERPSTASLGGINRLPPCQNTSTMVH